jgi:hypothetical protein
MKEEIQGKCKRNKKRDRGKGRKRENEIWI